MKIHTKAKCVECGRIFDLLDEDDAGEWYYGHDCDTDSKWDGWADRRRALQGQEDRR